jgi:hypothetical protein
MSSQAGDEPAVRLSAGDRAESQRAERDERAGGGGEREGRDEREGGAADAEDVAEQEGVDGVGVAAGEREEERAQRQQGGEDQGGGDVMTGAAAEPVEAEDAERGEEQQAIKRVDIEQCRAGGTGKGAERERMRSKCLAPDNNQQPGRARRNGDQRTRDPRIHHIVAEHQRAPRSKSFLVLFFKKELLFCSQQTWPHK